MISAILKNPFSLIWLCHLCPTALWCFVFKILPEHLITVLGLRDSKWSRYYSCFQKSILPSKTWLKQAIPSAMLLETTFVGWKELTWRRASAHAHAGQSAAREAQVLQAERKQVQWIKGRAVQSGSRSPERGSSVGFWPMTQERQKSRAALLTKGSALRTMEGIQVENDLVRSLFLKGWRWWWGVGGGLGVTTGKT